MHSRNTIICAHENITLQWQSMQIYYFEHLIFNLDSLDFMLVYWLNITRENLCDKRCLRSMCQWCRSNHEKFVFNPFHCVWEFLFCNIRIFITYFGLGAFRDFYGTCCNWFFNKEWLWAKIYYNKLESLPLYVSIQSCVYVLWGVKQRFSSNNWKHYYNIIL